MQMVPEVPHLNWLIFNNIASREAQGGERGLLPQASRCALVQGLYMTSRILRSDVSDSHYYPLSFFSRPAHRGSFLEGMRLTWGVASLHTHTLFSGHPLAAGGNHRRTVGAIYRRPYVMW